MEARGILEPKAPASPDAVPRNGSRMAGSYHGGHPDLVVLVT